MEKPTDEKRRERALGNDLRRAILTSLGDHEMRPRELRVALGGLSLSRLNYHLVVLEDAHLIRRDRGRYGRVGGEG